MIIKLKEKVREKRKIYAYDICTLQIWKEVISALPRPLRSTVENHRELFDIGLHGPDILFYYHPMKRNTVNGQGYDLHDKPADLFSATLRKL